MGTLHDDLDEVAERAGFSGVVRVDRDGETEVCVAYGYSDRALEIPNTVETQFGTASCAKTLTALMVLALVERGTLGLDTTARSLLGRDLPMIADDVTVEHLLAHRSGIGDYFDEDAFGEMTDYLLQVPVHTLATAEDYLAVLDGYPTVFPAGERFAYNNGGFVVLALLAERAAGVGYHELVRTLVTEPAGMVDTSFLRSDELPARAAKGYLEAEGLRTNLLHLPVVGVGDGGVYSTAADVSAFWEALYAERIVASASVAELVRPRSDWADGSERYGFGIHLHATGDAIWLEGHDAGVSATSLHQPSTSITRTVISNWTEGAWPIATMLDEHLGV